MTFLNVLLFSLTLVAAFSPASQSPVPAKNWQMPRGGKGRKLVSFHSFILFPLLFSPAELIALQRLPTEFFSSDFLFRVNAGLLQILHHH